jgi:hypothetical protein
LSETSDTQPRRPSPLTLRRQPRRNIFFTIFFFACHPCIFQLRKRWCARKSKM